MATIIPEEQLRFSQLAVTQGWIRPDQARAAMELYKRYADRSGSDVPSIPRILVNKGFIGRKQGEMLLRHIYKGTVLPEPSPPPPQPPAAPTPRTAFQPAQPPPLPSKPSVPKGVQAVSKNPPGPGTAPSTKEALPLPPTRTANVAPGAAIPRPPVAPGRNVPTAASYDPFDTDSAILEGLGALVLSKELQEIKSYRIESVVGEGAMGTVYRAVQVSMERVVALKVLPPERTRDPQFVQEFLDEARNAGRLNHPNLIRVHEVGKSGSLFYYSMEYIEGLRLDEMIDERDGGKLDLKQAILIFSQIASALEYGQKSGIIHRELRPNSVMITPDGLAKLADLGLVKDEETRFLVGENAYYVAPEQALGEPADTRSDIYSLGCCLFQAVTGERPFDEGNSTPQEVLTRRLNAPPPSPYQFNNSLPQELSRTILKMMQRDPAQRFQTPGEVFEALKKVNLSTQPTPPRVAPPRRKFRR